MSQPAHDPSSQTTSPGRLEPYGWHDPVPVPHASEHLNDTMWQLWEDVNNRRDFQFADTAPLTMPMPLRPDDVHIAASRPPLQFVPSGLTVDAVMAEARRGGRVCPRGEAWMRLFLALPDRDRASSGRGLAPPMDAAAIASLPALPIRLCLRQHVEWAAITGCLDATLAYFKGLPESDWHHVGE